ncbi:hypothetical protein [Streptomyces mirabilis]|uniref:hypothetical protein n=1 Tax=Streptomyces mirabilis TaxID=68239 RepID=UPI0032488D45
MQPQTLPGPHPEERLADRGDALLVASCHTQPQHRALVIADMQQMIDHALDHIRGVQRHLLGHAHHLQGYVRLRIT